MRLTVGPLPAAIYWRRRLLVLGVLALVILGVVYSCTGGPGAGSQAGPGPSDSPTPTGSATAAATATTKPSPTASPTPTAFTLPVAGATGPCTDAEIELTASASPSNPTVGVGADFSLKIKNVSSRTCVRDIGGVMQELQLRLGEQIVWSSDDCGANQDHYDETFTPGHERTFTRRWDGYVTRSGSGESVCGSGTKPNAGNYELVARLDELFSDPASVDVNSSGG